MTSAIEIKDLSKTFGHYCAIKSLNLSVPAGVFFGFVGPNGAGKTTTIRLLLGLLKPTRGSIHVLGQSVEEDGDDLKMQIGVVLEGLSLFDYLTGWEYLQFAGRMFKLDRLTLRTRAEELLALMELDDGADRLIADYSYGMKKKVALAAALMHHPRLLVLDEPFEGMDPSSRKVLEEVLLDLVAHEATIFLTSHALNLVEKLCTEVALIHKGELLVAGKMNDVMKEVSNLEELFFQQIPLDDQKPRKLSWVK